MRPLSFCCSSDSSAPKPLVRSSAPVATRVPAFTRSSTSQSKTAASTPRRESIAWRGAPESSGWCAWWSLTAAVNRARAPSIDAEEYRRPPIRWIAPELVSNPSPASSPTRIAALPGSSPCRPDSLTISASRSVADSDVAGIGRARRGEAPSVTVPPPIVVSGDGDRSTKRSPPRASTGSSRTMRTVRVLPPAIGAPAATTRAPTSAVARWNRTFVRGRSTGAWGSSVTSARSTVAACHSGLVMSVALRSTASRSTPTSATAARSPATMRSTDSPCLCNPRTRAVAPSGMIRTVASTDRVPDHTVPVTTVPVPRTVNARSTGKRKSEPSCRAGRPLWLARSLIALRNASTPRSVTTDVGTMAARAKAVAASSSRTSSVTSSSHSASTRSLFVSATTAPPTCRSSRIARCSRVWGIGPSSAAMTRSATSIPVAPASIVRTNASCPGTSTTPIMRPSSSRSGANPRSMVIPRRFSSGSRSVSTPVSARTSAVLP